MSEDEWPHGVLLYEGEVISWARVLEQALRNTSFKIVRGACSRRELPVCSAAMNRNTFCIACCWLLSAAVSSLAAGDAPAAVFSAEEATLCTQLALKNQPWAAPRWEVSLTEARARAAKENKPIFLVVNTGNVLGFV